MEAHVQEPITPPLSLATRLRRRLLELVAPPVARALKRRFWNRAWADGGFPSPRNFWFLPDGVVPLAIREALESGWIPRGARVVDLGCGDGTIAAHLAGAGCDVLGVDYAAPAIARARARYGESATLRYQVLDVCQEIPGPGPFDVIVDRGCFHGLPAHARPAYLRTLTACTAPGSRVLLLHKVAGRTDLDAGARARVADRVVARVRQAFAPTFQILETRTLWFNSRGDDDSTASLPGAAIRLIRV
jgi:SAM-dependent methyltransferase